MKLTCAPLCPADESPFRTSVTTVTMVDEGEDEGEAGGERVAWKALVASAGVLRDKCTARFALHLGNETVRAKPPFHSLSSKRVAPAHCSSPGGWSCLWVSGGYGGGEGGLGCGGSEGGLGGGGGEGGAGGIDRREGLAEPKLPTLALPKVHEIVGCFQEPLAVKPKPCFSSKPLRRDRMTPRAVFDTTSAA